MNDANIWSMSDKKYAMFSPKNNQYIRVGYNKYLHTLDNPFPKNHLDKNPKLFSKKYCLKNQAMFLKHLDIDVDIQEFEIKIEKTEYKQDEKDKNLYFKMEKAIQALGVQALGVHVNSENCILKLLTNFKNKKYIVFFFYSTDFKMAGQAANEPKYNGKTPLYLASGFNSDLNYSLYFYFTFEDDITKITLYKLLKDAEIDIKVYDNELEKII